MRATIIHLPEIDSTNSHAIGLLSKDRPKEGSVFVAVNQTHGKGMDINKWESEYGKNLTFSLILYPSFAADQQFILNKAISLGIFDFLKTEISGHKICIKWPNDIYIGDKKACGILIQNSVIGNKLDYVVVGIGLNVNQTLFISDAPNPVSMKMTTARDYNLDKILGSLLHCIFRRYAQVKPESTQKIENEYQKTLYRLMEWHDYFVRDAKIQARIRGTNPYGQLLLETKNEEVLACDLKEVKFVI